MMNVTLTSGPLSRIRAGLLVIPVIGSPAKAALVREVDRITSGAVLDEIRQRQFTGSRGQECWIHTRAGAAPTLLLLGRGTEADVASWYELADAVARHATRMRVQRAGVAFGAHGDPEVVGAVAEGLALARYVFSRYLSHPPPTPSLAVTLAVARVDRAHRVAVGDALTFARATTLARDLANTPAADLTPRDLARVARGLARRGVGVRVHDPRALARLRMGGILGVGRGSEHPPCFIELAYTPRRPRRRVALIGKGITFDSGGLSLKTAEAMQAQKRDMAGAAVVLSVMSVLPALRLPIEVRGYLPVAENMPSGSAMRPGDVLRACNGTTIEVLNTDAEGRLVLADALAYAARRKPDLLLDFATLTAVVRAALGPRCAAVLGTDRAAIDGLIAAGRESNEMLWELPLIGEYRRDLDSRVADLKNVGEGHAGTIVAALFLREFVGGLRWAHVDFSSTVMSEGFPCHPKGASGFGVRTTLRFLRRLAADR
jgi:leucyl aminopeptidase